MLYNCTYPNMETLLGTHRKLPDILYRYLGG